MPANDTAPFSVIGKDRPRVDGPLKVSGRAMYTSDYNFPDALYAVPVGSTIGKGEILQLDTDTADMQNQSSSLEDLRGMIRRFWPWGRC